MDMSSLGALFENFDLAAFLPKVDSILGWVETLLRLCVMAGPLLVLGLGLLYLLAPPKEANYRFGYRFFWSMASLDAWQYTHRLAGMVWSALGGVLTVWMALICNAFRRMPTMDMVQTSAECLLWQMALVALSCIAIDIVVVVIFDSKGFRRRETEEE